MNHYCERIASLKHCFLANSKVRGLKSCCHMVVYIYISVTRNLVIVQLRERLALLKVSQKEIEEKKRDEILEAKQVLLQHTVAFCLKKKKKKEKKGSLWTHSTKSFLSLYCSFQIKSYENEPHYIINSVPWSFFNYMA